MFTAMELVPQFRHRLRKVDANSSIIEQAAVHLLVRQLSLFRLFEFDKCVLQRSAGLPISDDLAAQKLAESTKRQC